MNEDYKKLDKIADGECTCGESGHCKRCIAAGAINEVAEILANATSQIERMG